MSRIRAKLEILELEAVNVGSRWVVDTHLPRRQRRSLVEDCADNVEPETKLVEETVAEDVRFRDAAETTVQRRVEREIQVVCARNSAGLDLQVVRTERLIDVGIGPEETKGNAVMASAKLSVSTAFVKRQVRT